MNVYVRELCAALARSGVECDVFTRAWASDWPPSWTSNRVSGSTMSSRGPPATWPKRCCPPLIDEFTDGVLARMTSARGREPDDGFGRFEAVHANYWLSGLSGHVIKHELDLPLVCTFHTLDRVKAVAGPGGADRADVPHRRSEAEATIIVLLGRGAGACDVEAEQLTDS